MAETPGLVPVIKGNGYGFGIEELARTATGIGADTIAVGTAAEALRVLPHTEGDVVVMMPWFAADEVAAQVVGDPRVIVTVTHLRELEALAGSPEHPRVLVEVRTSMCRHGLAAEDLGRVAELVDRVDFAGWAIHLPMPAGGSNLGEATDLGTRAQAAVEAPLWFSHISDDDHNRLRDLFGPSTRVRRGTQLWLGEPAALRVTAGVLDVHKVVKGQPVGYHRKPVPANGWVVVVAGGTANGVGLEAPSTNRSMRDRVKTLALGALDAAGRARSPYEIDGAKRDFLEPPHMQSSLVFLPSSATPPVIGDEVPVTMRNTTAVFDDVRFI